MTVHGGRRAFITGVRGQLCRELEATLPDGWLLADGSPSLDVTDPESLRRPLELSAPHPLGEIAFEDCRVPADARVGAEGEGFKLGLATLDRLRPTVAAAACGMAARALAEASERLKGG